MDFGEQYFIREGEAVSRDVKCQTIFRRKTLREQMVRKEQKCKERRRRKKTTVDVDVFVDTEQRSFRTKFLCAYQCPQKINIDIRYKYLVQLM